ncbi:hypothetical protein QBC45DRAFT_345145 [Copromyces sp. CBS 386.78]|nr:hypothetical protein QBC45DRAFT_345145 [Copromyces sp. CBS 386.78]
MRAIQAGTILSSLLLSLLPLTLSQLVLPSNLPGVWEYDGCYTEVDRTIGAAAYADDDDMTNEACISFCTARGFQYAGTQYAQECYCGESIATTAVKLEDSQCSMACKGNATEPCGGPSKLSIFHSSAAVGPQPNPGVNGFSHLGCYSEGTTGRTLTFGVGTIPGASMTVGKCTAACDSSGYKYAGVEFGGECFCGNRISNGGAPATSGCTMLCNGNSTEFCGGGNRLNIYIKGDLPPTSTVSGIIAVTSSAVPEPQGPAQPASVGNYVWYGCRTEATGNRALSAAVSATDEMTLEACSAFCSAYTYFGVEYSRECYCGNSFNAGSVAAPDSDCSMTCAGKPTEYCGAGNRLSVYAKNGTEPPSTTAISSSAVSSSSPEATGLPEGWAYKGCWSEGTTGRLLNHQAPDSQTNSQVVCAAYCASKGYTISGTEYGVQCFCGNSLFNNGAKIADSQCSVNCPGDASQKCGAGGRVSIVARGEPKVNLPPVPKGTVGDWTYSGCYENNINNQRTFFWQSLFPNVMTPKMCLDRCAEYGYMAAAIEYGEECFCGDPANIETSGATKRPESECNIVCPGETSSICGGGNRLTTYFWTGTPFYSWDFPQDYRAGKYELLINGVTVPLMTSETIQGKVSFLSKWGTGPANETGAYELDLSKVGTNAAFRELHLKTDVFCAGGVTLPDKVGRQLTVGGWSGDSTYGTRLYWPGHDWEENVNELSLQAGRWYPSAMVMANGSIFVIGGETGSNAAAVPSIEILPYTGTKPLYMDWLERTNPNNLYPFVAVLPSGGIFVQYWNEARILDEKTFATIKVLPMVPGAVNDPRSGRTYPLEGAAVLLPQRYPYTENLGILICGGSNEGPGYALDNCVSTRPDDANPKWVIERMPSFRVMPCMAPLPDGTYLIANGAHHGFAGFGLANNPNKNALLYNPTKPVGSRITVMANTTIARMYHSEAITLLDGRVLISGSDPQDNVNPEEYRVEVFVPPYLLNGKPRPTFTLSNKDWDWNQKNIAFTLGSAAKNGAITVTLLGSVSSTHGNSMGARTLMPNVQCQGTRCMVDAPPSAHVAPPGWYQFFVLDGGVPAVGVYVRIGGDPAGLGNWPNSNGFSKPGV